MHPNLPSAFAISTILSLHGYSKKNFSRLAILTTFITGLVIFTLSASFGVLLTVFYVTSSKLTHFKADKKKKIEVFTTVRNATQVITNSIWVTLASITLYFYPQYSQQISCFVLGVVCCCCGDTWASEIGSVSSSTPMLITTFQQVVAGTNGAVSGLGLLASAAGGAMIGLTCYITSVLMNYVGPSFTLFEFVCYGAMLGLIGSLVTFQLIID